jgi:hypothetical protein
MNNLPADHRFFRFQERVNEETVPSERVIESHIAQTGDEYRFQTEGEHPIDELRVASAT